MQDFLSFLNNEGSGQEWMVFLIAGCALLMWAECKFMRQMHGNLTCEDPLEGWKMFANCVLTVFTSCLVFYYVYSMGSRSLWFIMPSEVHGPLNGWLYTIGNGIIFYYVLFDVVVNFFGTMIDFTEYIDKGIDVRWGFVVLAIGVLAFLVCLSWKPEYANYVLWGTVASQIVQLGIICYNCYGRIPVLHTAGICLVYVLGSLSTVMLCLPLILILIGLVITLLVLTLASKMPTGSGTVDNSPKYIQIHTSANGDRYYHDENGKYTPLYGDTPPYYDSKGRSWNELGYRMS